MVYFPSSREGFYSIQLLGSSRPRTSIRFRLPPAVLGSSTVRETISLRLSSVLSDPTYDETLSYYLACFLADSAFGTIVS